MSFTFSALAIPDIILIQPEVFFDSRGFFFESFKASDFEKFNIPTNFVQENISLSRKNVLRGLHYQKDPKAQGKLVSVLRGGVLDVAVDIRNGSKSFLKWVAVDLNDRNHAALYIPPGFAHGFLALSDDVHILYKCTKEYDSKLDAGIRWDDPDIGIAWPVQNPILSDKDKNLPYVKKTKAL